ncbi:unnamed protein product [Rotaria sordida]|uniref:Diacylglycerol kinase n=1 Tax=Rotaria sordida TaxID=392033 RepID=A0A814KJE8_9BILA|nr:unnamed protein product [Rotaria sordida]CAF4023216.1 unnamed protein product [Rotaria sordida]
MLNYLETNDVSSTPVIFFINKLSGGQKGDQVYRTLVHLLNPRQVFLLENDTTIMQALNIYSSLSNIRICICGGDGTVAWILSRLMDAFPPLKNPPVSICPLGTGNDMSRALGWGYRYKPKQLMETLTQISRAHSTPLDRWRIQIEALEINRSNNEFVNRRRRFSSFMRHPKFIRNAEQPFYDNHRTPINTYFFNYISFGLDAAIVVDYYASRTRHPSKFTSPLKNKILCINESRKYFNDFAFGIAWDLTSYIRLICDGQDFTDSIRHCHSLIVLNTRSFGSGTHPWSGKSKNRIESLSDDHEEDDSFDQISTHSLPTHDSPINDHDENQTTTTIGGLGRAALDNFETQDFGDRKIEVLGLNIRQMALIRMGFRGHRITQCSQLRIELNHPMPVHMDGGPFYLAGSMAVNITHAGQVMVLTNHNR